MLIHTLTQVGFLFSRRGTRHHIRFLQLPADIGGPVQRLSRKRRAREVIIDAIVKAHGVLVCPLAASPSAGLTFGVRRFAEQDLVAVGSGCPHHSFIQQPTGNGFSLPLLLLVLAALGLSAKQGFDVRPTAAGLQNHDFVPASHFRQLGRIRVWRQIECCRSHQRPALANSKSRSAVQNHQQAKNQPEIISHHSHFPGET